MGQEGGDLVYPSGLGCLGRGGLRNQSSPPAALSLRSPAPGAALCTGVAGIRLAPPGHPGAAWPGRRLEEEMSVEQTMDDIARGVEILGVATVVVGLAASLVNGGLGLLRGEGAGSVYGNIRAVFARSILLGLEFLVAADIIRTVAVQPSLENVAVLGLIILIRTFLSFSLEVELDGRWPWARAPSGSPGPAQSGRRIQG